MTLQTMIQMNLEYSRMIKKSSNYAKIIGNRLSSRITIQANKNGIIEQELISLTAPHMADTLNQVDIYDQDYRVLFSRHISSHTYTKELLDGNIASKVIHDQFSHITYHKDGNYVVGYFPIDFSVKSGEMFSRKTGIIHLVFDVSADYEEAKQMITMSALMNIGTIFIMVVLFSLLMYFLVFQRLNALHKATDKLLKGDFDVHVNSKGDDELTQVIHTFNTMAVEMHQYKHTMEERIKQALHERTEQTKLLVQQSRLASMGEMIGNIAHQWRQPLNALGLIIQKIQIFSERGKLTETLLKENIEKGTFIINNMSRTIDDFRDFFKPDKQKEYFLLREAVQEVMALLQGELYDCNIHVEVGINPSGCLIYGFRNEFSQVIINLMNNSKDALNEKNISHKKIYITGYIEGNHTILKVSDNAGGISLDVLGRIFEPYYTTKVEGKGTGIGLYMSKMIIEENMHGSMQVRNNELGAEFSMTFKNEKDKE